MCSKKCICCLLKQANTRQKTGHTDRQMTEKWSQCVSLHLLVTQLSVFGKNISNLPHCLQQESFKQKLLTIHTSLQSTYNY